MANVGQDGAAAIFWDGDYGWAVQFRDRRSRWRREYLVGFPVEPAEQKWPIQKVAKLAAAVVPKDQMFVFPFARNASKIDGSIIINNGKVTSTSSAK